MSSSDVLDALRSVRFLQGIGQPDLQRLAGIASIRDVPADAVLFREGQPHTLLYLIVEGGVALDIRVTPQVVKRLQTIGEGELLGWSPLLGSGEMTGTARAIVPTRAVAIDAAQLLAICEHDTRFGFEFLRRVTVALARRLNATRLQLLDVYNHELPAFAVGQEV